MIEHKINVESKHIEEGYGGNCCRCPMALALRDIWVKGKFYNYSSVDNGDIHLYYIDKENPSGENWSKDPIENELDNFLYCHDPYQLSSLSKYEIILKGTDQFVKWTYNFDQAYDYFRLREPHENPYCFDYYYEKEPSYWEDLNISLKDFLTHVAYEMRITHVISPTSISFNDKDLIIDINNNKDIALDTDLLEI